MSTSVANTPLASIAVRDYLTGLQTRITDAIAAIDGGSFLVDAWEKPAGEPLQGQGITKILEGGSVFERAATDVSNRAPRGTPASRSMRASKDAS